MSHQKMTLALGFALLAAPAWSKISTFQTQDRLMTEITVDGIQSESVTIDGQAFDRLRLQGVDGLTAVNYEEGAPGLPVIRFYVDADRASDVQIMASKNTFSLSKKVHNILPVLPSLAKIPGSRYRASDLKVRKAPLRDQEYDIEDAGVVRGQQRFLVTLYPVILEGLKASVKRNFKVSVKKPAIGEIPMKARDGLVFIVGERFKDSPALEKYKALKDRLGFDVHTLNVTTVEPETIRTQLQELYAKNPSLKFALIVGDAEDVPGKDSINMSGTTDLYYGALDTNYEEDINSPDLFVGRVSARDGAELDQIFKKLSAYQSDLYSTQSLLNYVSFIATDDRYEVAEGTHNYVIDTYTKKAKYKGIFPTRSRQGGDRLYAITHHASTENVMQAISKGRAIINYSGHGAQTYWAGPLVTQENVRSIKSKTFPFVISNACVTADFREEESFAETWIRHEFGAISFLGSMDLSYWDEDDIFERRLFDGIFTKNKQNFGEITDYGLAETWREYGGEGKSKYYRESYHLFGDPSLKLRISSFH